MIDRYRPRRRAAALWLTAALLALALAACGGEDDSGPSGSAAGGHVHGLGIDPSDGALFVATHNGLFRSEAGSEAAERVGASEQDTMGFSITGPEEFLGSGHPGPGQDDPPNLGLIRSDDAGQSWETISLAGEADFHILRSQGERVYGFNGLSTQLMVSEDGGESWQSRQPPGDLIDLAIDPGDPDRVLASTARGLALSENGADSWEPVAAEIGLLAWPSSERLYLIDGAGAVSAGEPGEELRQVGEIGAQPVAFVAAGEQELYAALADGSVLQSGDGGSSWTQRTAVGS